MWLWRNIAVGACVGEGDIHACGMLDLIGVDFMLHIRGNSHVTVMNGFESYGVAMEAWHVELMMMLWYKFHTTKEGCPRGLGLNQKTQLSKDSRP